MFFQIFLITTTIFFGNELISKPPKITKPSDSYQMVHSPLFPLHKPLFPLPERYEETVDKKKYQMTRNPNFFTIQPQPPKVKPPVAPPLPPPPPYLQTEPSSAEFALALKEKKRRGESIAPFELKYSLLSKTPKLTKSSETLFNDAMFKLEILNDNRRARGMKELKYSTTNLIRVKNPIPKSTPEKKLVTRNPLHTGGPSESAFSVDNPLNAGSVARKVHSSPNLLATAAKRRNSQNLMSYKSSKAATSFRGKPKTDRR